MASDTDVADLVEAARDVRETAYKPYSEYGVGAAVVTDDGSVYTGVNIENITFDMCSHAERTAMRSAIADGHRSFAKLAISTLSQDGEPPCGTCRQFIAEFCPDEFPIYSDTGDGNAPEEYTLGEIFPYAFRPDHVAEAVETVEDDQ